MQTIKVLLFGALALSLAGCGSKSDDSGARREAPIRYAKPDALPTGPDSIFFGPEIGHSQTNSRLSNLFDTKGNSNLCAPTSIAHALYYQAYSKVPAITGLQSVLPASGDRNADLVAETRIVAEKCGFDRSTGTSPVTYLPCIRSIFASAGVDNLEIKRVSESDTFEGGEERDVSFEDLRSALKARKSVLMSIGFYRYVESEKKWKYTAGHLVVVYGYQYDQTKDTEMDIWIFDPMDRLQGPAYRAAYRKLTMKEVVKKDGTRTGAHFLEGRDEYDWRVYDTGFVRSISTF